MLMDVKPGLASELLESLVRMSPDCIKLICPDGRIRFMSPNGRRAMGLPLIGTVEGADWASLWPESTRGLVEKALNTCRETMQPASFRGFCPTADGSPRWWDVSITPVREGGELGVFLAFSRDVSHFHAEGGQLETLKELVATLSREREKLAEQKANEEHGQRLRLLGQFASSIVHDLNNVLAAMQSASSLLKRRVEGSVGQDILNHVDQAIGRGSQLTRQLLDLSRRETGGVEVLDLQPLIESDVGLLEHLVGPNIALNLACDDELPPVLLSSSHFRSVLFNLVANARDAIDGDGRISVGLTTREIFAREGDLLPGRYAVVEVADDGCGMPPDVVARLGQPFFTTKSEGHGTGLGVPSAFELAKQCEGKVDIESVAGEGTKIRVWIRASDARGAQIAIAATEPHQHGNATILLVENSQLFREHISNLLGRLGYTVLEAASSSSAIPIAVAAAKVDLLISDLHLDDGEGHAVAEEMRSRFPGLPIIFLSGTHGKTVPETEVLLRKPVDEAKLAQAILEQLGRLPARHLTEKLLSRSRHLQDRLRHPSAVEVYRAWRLHCDVCKRLPNSRDLEAVRDYIAADGYMVEIAGARSVPTFRFASASPGLERRLGRPLAGTYVTSVDEDTLSSIGRALKRAMRGVAYFDYAEVKSNEGSERFERLMLPLSENGQDVTHLVGLVSFEELD